MSRIILGVAKLPIMPTRHYSALFISDRCTQERPVLTPTPDLENKFKDIEKLQKNLDARNIKTEAGELKDLYQFFCRLKEIKDTLEQRRVDIASQIKSLIQDNDANQEQDRLILEGRIVKTDLKNMMPGYWEVEERLMLNCLDLPNDIHPRTPLKSCLVVSPPKSVETPQFDHVVSGQQLIDIRSPHWYYLKSDAAIFDLALMYYFLEGLGSVGFKKMVLPDFAHDAVLEACGTNPTTAISLEPLGDRFNLVGGASIFPYCAYYAKQVARRVPEMYTSGGRRYVLPEGEGLFGVWQRTCVNMFSVSSFQDNEAIFEKTVDAIRDLYDVLGWNYQVKYVSASKLQAWESSRVSFEMPARHGWVEVGHVSTSGTFLSERLSMKIENSDRTKEFAHIISGCAVDVTVVLACLLEQNVDLFPTCLKPHSFELF